MSKVIIPGPFSAATDDATVNRARRLINGYFEKLRSANPERWELGRAAYICVNPGIRAHLTLISEIVKYFQYKRSVDFQMLNDQQIVEYLTEIAKPVFDQVKSASNEEILEKYSRKFGEGGVKEYLFNMCELVRGKFEDFGSDEFIQYLEQKDDDRVSDADHTIINLTNDITNYVVDV